MFGLAERLPAEYVSRANCRSGGTAVNKKKIWRKPDVKRIKAGSAEFGSGVKGDGAGGGSIHS